MSHPELLQFFNRVGSPDLWKFGWICVIDFDGKTLTLVKFSQQCLTILSVTRLDCYSRQVSALRTWFEL